MVQSRCRLGFALKAGECLRVTGNLPRQELEGDEAMKPRVLGFVDDAHAAAAEFLDDAVVRDGLADHGGAATLGCNVRDVAEAKSKTTASSACRKVQNLANSEFLSPALRRSRRGKEMIVNPSEFHGRRAFFVVVRHPIDPSAYGIAPHQPSIIRLQQFGLDNSGTVSLEFWRMTGTDWVGAML
jgi:hypothetical protein